MFKVFIGNTVQIHTDFSVRPAGGSVKDWTEQWRERENYGILF
jgi:hypothetical protein